MASRVNASRFHVYGLDCDDCELIVVDSPVKQSLLEIEFCPHNKQYIERKGGTVCTLHQAIGCVIVNTVHLTGIHACEWLEDQGLPRNWPAPGISNNWFRKTKWPASAIETSLIPNDIKGTLTQEWNNERGEYFGVPRRLTAHYLAEIIEHENPGYFDISRKPPIFGRQREMIRLSRSQLWHRTSMRLNRERYPLLAEALNGPPHSPAAPPSGPRFITSHEEMSMSEAVDLLNAMRQTTQERDGDPLSTRDFPPPETEQDPIGRIQDRQHWSEPEDPPPTYWESQEDTPPVYLDVVEDQWDKHYVRVSEEGRVIAYDPLGYKIGDPVLLSPHNFPIIYEPGPRSEAKPPVRTTEVCRCGAVHDGALIGYKIADYSMLLQAIRSDPRCCPLRHKEAQ